MKLRDVLSVIEGEVFFGQENMDLEIHMGCGADLMSDVLSFTRYGTLLMTGLTNPQVVRTAEIVGIKAIVFVQSKLPPPETIALAEARGIPLLASQHTMFEICGRLYQAGLASSDLS